MIRISPSGVMAQPGAAEQLREEFVETGCAMMRGFMTAPLLELLLRQLETAHFETTDEIVKTNGRVFGTTLKLRQSEPGVVALNFVLNRPELFELARQIGGTPALGNFLGRLHRTTAGSDQQIEWHHDHADFRSLGLDINLSGEAYEGGLFQIRDSDLRIRREIKEWDPGDAFLFRIGNGWQHRLTRVESGRRTVGVGWFRTEPDWQLLTSARVRSGIVTTMESTR
jgi:hypothetical protein